MIYFNYFKTPVKIVRPFNIFGPGMLRNDFRVIPRFIYSVLHDEQIPVHGNGKQTRTFCYISDAVAGFFLVLLAGYNGEVYNVGSNQKEISINRLAKIFNTVFDNKLKVKNVPYPRNYPQGEPKRRCPDVSKIKKENIRSMPVYKGSVIWDYFIRRKKTFKEIMKEDLLLKIAIK